MTTPASPDANSASSAYSTSSGDATNPYGASSYGASAQSGYSTPTAGEGTYPGAQEGFGAQPGQGAYGQAYGQSNQQPYAAGYQQAAQGYAAAPAGYGGKSKMAAGLLAILIGSLGIHNFYLGHTNRGVAQLLITVLSCGMLSVVSWVWAIIEGVQILSAQPGSLPWGVDAQGYPLQA